MPSSDNWYTYVLDLVPIKVRNAVDNNPRQTPSKINHFMHRKAHNASGKNIVLHVNIPRQPEAFEVVKGDIILGNFFELAPVRVLIGEGVRRRRISGCRSVARNKEAKDESRGPSSRSSKIKYVQ